MSKAGIDDLTIRGFTGETICKDPDSIRGADFAIEDIERCTIYVMDHTSQMTVDNVHDSKLFIGPVQGSFFLRDCSDCIIAVACRQFRTKNVERCKIFLFCSSRPSIEYTWDIKLAPYNFAYPHQDQHFKLANLNPQNNDWANVYDFNADRTPHWSVLPTSEFFSEKKELLGFTPAVNPVVLPTNFKEVAGTKRLAEEVKSTVKAGFSLSSVIEKSKATSEEEIIIDMPPQVLSPQASTAAYKPFERLGFENSQPPASPPVGQTIYQLPPPVSSAPILSASPEKPPPILSQPLVQSSFQMPQTTSQPAAKPPLQIPPSAAQPVPQPSLQIPPQVKSESVKLSIPVLVDSSTKTSTNLLFQSPSYNQISYNGDASFVSISQLKNEESPLKQTSDSDSPEIIFYFSKGHGYLKPRALPPYLTIERLERPLEELSAVSEKAHERLILLDFIALLVFLGLMIHILLAICLKLIEDWFDAAWGVFLAVFLVGAVGSTIVIGFKVIATKKAAKLKLEEIVGNIDLKNGSLKCTVDLNSLRISSVSSLTANS